MGKPEGKSLLGRPRHRWEDNIQMDLQEVGWGGGIDWIDLFQDRERWHARVKAGNFLTSRQPVASPMLHGVGR